jgi:probable phosphoglycerate mutase
MESRGWRFRAPGGEDRITVWERCRRALLEAAEKWPGETVLVVAHEGVIKCLIYALKEHKFTLDEPAILHSGYLHWLDSGEDRLRIAQINAIALSKP